ncbi:site-2 protease family protein [Candidatus Bathyarchaeota archaeon]|nr:site-2 protease family protein [Candidatus Bathyarchaeota archaeon]
MAGENETARFFRILDIIKTECTPREAYVREGIPTFVIPYETQVMERVNRLALRFSTENLGLLIGQSDSDITLQVVPRQQLSQPTFRFLGVNLSVILFLVTVVTVTISGYLVSSEYVQTLRTLEKIVASDISFAVWSQTILYTITIMGVIGLHEVGHFIMAKKHGVKSTLPLFIPGIPGLTIGTFGAFIRQERPATNRNQLFDIGFTGPIVGFTIAMIASVIGYSMSLGLTRQEYTTAFGAVGGGDIIIPPLIFLLAGNWIFTNPNAYIYILHPLALAGWAGTLITFLNAFPIGQLDGGHISRALLGRVWHRRLGYAMIAVMVLAGWWTMAFLVLFFIRVDHPGTLDDATPLTFKRKLLGVAFALMFVAVFILSPDSPFLFILTG